MNNTLNQVREALERLSAYPKTRADELSAESMRQIARSALSSLNAEIEAVELSDEQLHSLWVEHAHVSLGRGGMAGVFRFARAILSSAGKNGDAG